MIGTGGFGLDYPLIASAAFGLEGVTASELRHMGITVKAEQGGARFTGTLADAYRANLWLRTADRVLMVLCECEVTTFEDLFQAVSGIAWEKLLPMDAAIPVSGKCVRSRLMSVRDCQAVAKKAIVNRLLERLRVPSLPETGVSYPIEVALRNDQLRVTDLSLRGTEPSWLSHLERGSAAKGNARGRAGYALSPWRPGLPLYDPCCGTGTLLVEAAMLATRRARA